MQSFDRMTNDKYICLFPKRGQPEGNKVFILVLERCLKCLIGKQSMCQFDDKFIIINL